jgi:hypothetical protein
LSDSAEVDWGEGEVEAAMVESVATVGDVDDIGCETIESVREICV